MGPKKALMRAGALYGLCLLPLFFAKNFIQGVVTCLLLSFGLAGIMVLLDICIADVTDEDEVKTGVRREGMYFGVHGFMIRLGISISASIMGPVMKRTGYDANLAVQPASALVGFRVLMSFIPMVAIGLGLVILRYYPLDGKKLEDMKARVAMLHAEKARK
jgi:GPH family glycoside/pentoside/hexuronide:cation symporter